MRTLAKVAWLLSFALADRDMMRFQEYDADVSEHVQAEFKEEKTFKVLQFNVGWECAAVPNFGSGKVAAVHCKTGKFKDEVDSDKLPIWEPDNVTREVINAKPFWTANTTPWNTLVTSCQNTFLHKMKGWSKSAPADVITLDELANPGTEGMAKLGRPEDTLPSMVTTQQQIDPKIYGTLTDNILSEYGVFTHVVTNHVIGMQATFFKKSSLADNFDLGFGFNFLSDTGGERPCTALFFWEKQTLVLNIHSVHFRKTLLAPNAAEQFGSAHGKTIQQYGASLKTGFEVGTETANMNNFDTANLQALFGMWVEAKLDEMIETCQDGKPLDKNQMYCKVNGINWVNLRTLIGNLKDQRAASWKIFAAGDFNDETMELSEFKIWGTDLKIETTQRKRTCCSDRDQNFKKVATGAAHVADEDVSRKPHHTKANTDYMEEQGKGACKYVPSGQLDDWLDKHKELNPMTLSGAPQVLGDGTETESTYPFPSDIILSNKPGGDLTFPEGYQQRMSTITNGYVSDPTMPSGNYENGMISDHDPVQRTFTWTE